MIGLVRTLFSHPPSVGRHSPFLKLADTIRTVTVIREQPTSTSFLHRGILAYYFWLVPFSWVNLVAARKGSSAVPIQCFGRRHYSKSLSNSAIGGNHRRLMSSFVTLRNGGTITVAPKQETDQSALVVISHGLGDTAEGFADVAEMMAKAMPHVKFILPTAPTQPVTMNMGMAMPSWYDITGLDERSNEQCAGLEVSVQTLTRILDTEHTNTGLPYERMVLAGFSQGGALSLFTTFGLPQRIAGVVCLSAYLPAAKQFRVTPGLQDTPVLHCHGTQDAVVPFAMAEKSAAKVKQVGVTNYTFKSYPIGHTVDPRTELLDVLKFLQEILPADASYNIKVKEASEMSVKELREAIRSAGLSHKAVGLMEKPEFVRLLQDHRDGKL